MGKTQITGMEENPENLFCKKCSLQFDEKAVYNMHLSSGHEITIQQAVDNLNFKLSKIKQEDDRLMPTTNPEKEFVCEKCSLQFIEKAVYDIHFLIEHGNMIQEAFDVKKQEESSLKPRKNNRLMPTTNPEKEFAC